MSVILETKQLCKFYGAGENQVKAVNQVDIQIEQGEFVAIVGKSGSGKSTLLHMLGGLDTPTKGSVTLAGKDLYRMKDFEKVKPCLESISLIVPISDNFFILICEKSELIVGGIY